MSFHIDYTSFQVDSASIRGVLGENGMLDVRAQMLDYREQMLDTRYWILDIIKAGTQFPLGRGIMSIVNEGDVNLKLEVWTRLTGLMD